ncbi:unnamed protein product [Prorocentrum cordatum]|uniref:Dynein heavy chain linker domain-containing protein n=1 Tax=Prorocentrum cordatum TaxID=2364126 RepID=A0ABN9PJD3_9DINO|nr:unnamed protein product [Polarella glacialis]
MERDPSFTLSRVIDMDVGKHITELQEISDSASREYSLETTLSAMTEQWAPVVFEVKPWKDTETYIVNSTTVDEMQSLMDDHVIKAQTMKGSPYATAFMTAIVEMENWLLNTQEIMDVWLKVQAVWLYLEPIFGSEDIVKQMPTEAALFKEVDYSWRSTMAMAKQEEKAMAVTKVEGLLQTLKDCHVHLETVQKGLNDYLETKRLRFPRFFFLSNDNLLEILSETKDPTRVNPHMKKAFEGIQSLEFTADSRIVAMNSSEKERVPLATPVDPAKARGSVELWLVEVEASMLETVRAVTMQAHDAYPSTRFVEWLKAWPGQVVIAIFCLYWTREVSSALRTEGNAGAARARPWQLAIGARPRELKPAAPGARGSRRARSTEIHAGRAEARCLAMTARASAKVSIGYEPTPSACGFNGVEGPVSAARRGQKQYSAAAVCAQSCLAASSGSPMPGMPARAPYQAALALQQRIACIAEAESRWDIHKHADGSWMELPKAAPLGPVYFASAKQHKHLSHVGDWARERATEGWMAFEADPRAIRLHGQRRLQSRRRLPPWRLDERFGKSRRPAQAQVMPPVAPPLQPPTKRRRIRSLRERGAAEAAAAAAGPGGPAPPLAAPAGAAAPPLPGAEGGFAGRAELAAPSPEALAAPVAPPAAAAGPARGLRTGTKLPLLQKFPDLETALRRWRELREAERSEDKKVSFHDALFNAELRTTRGAFEQAGMHGGLPEKVSAGWFVGHEKRLGILDSAVQPAEVRRPERAAIEQFWASCAQGRPQVQEDFQGSRVVHGVSPAERGRALLLAKSCRPPLLKAIQEDFGGHVEVVARRGSAMTGATHARVVPEKMFGPLADHIGHVRGELQRKRRDALAKFNLVRELLPENSTPDLCEVGQIAKIFKQEKNNVLHEILGDGPDIRLRPSRSPNAAAHKAAGVLREHPSAALAGVNDLRRRQQALRKQNVWLRADQDSSGGPAAEAPDAPAPSAEELAVLRRNQQELARIRGKLLDGILAQLAGGAEDADGASLSRALDASRATPFESTLANVAELPAQDNVGESKYFLAVGARVCAGLVAPLASEAAAATGAAAAAAPH